MGFVIGLLIVINLCFAVAVIHKTQDLNSQIRRASFLHAELQTTRSDRDDNEKIRKRAETDCISLRDENAELRKKLLVQKRAIETLSEAIDDEKQINVDHQQKIVERDSALVRYRDFYNAINAAMRNRRGIA